MVRKQIDWAAIEGRAQGMTVEALRYARQDAAETARLWDSTDRTQGTDVAGYYRDEASIYARELTARGC